LKNFLTYHPFNIFSATKIQHNLPKPQLITDPANIAGMICISSPGVCRGKILVVIDGVTGGQESNAKTVVFMRMVFVWLGMVRLQKIQTMSVYMMR
jgi:hypothetical protein